MKNTDQGNFGIETGPKRISGADAPKSVRKKLERAVGNPVLGDKSPS
jgi:hypothetical protein